MYSKEELDRIKEEDYILWSELTSDPAGSSGEEPGCISMIVAIIAIIFGVILLYNLIK